VRSGYDLERLRSGDLGRRAVTVAVDGAAGGAATLSEQETAAVGQSSTQPRRPSESRKRRRRRSALSAGLTRARCVRVAGL